MIGNVKYTGDGTQYIQGIPARDLSLAEWDELPEEARAFCLRSGLYELPAEKPPRRIVTDG